MKMYGSKICKDCVDTKALLEEQNIPFEYIEITESVATMRAFLQYRDHAACLQQGKAEGRICIPFFVSDDGEVSTEWQDFQVVKSCETC